MLREKEIENTVGYIWINSILKKLEELELITGKELEATDKNISELLNVEYKYSPSCHALRLTKLPFGNSISAVAQSILLPIPFFLYYISTLVHMDNSQ